MPKFLIVAATRLEVQPVLDHFKITVNDTRGLFLGDSNSNVSVLITGVGMVNTAFYLGKYSAPGFDLLINVGICGAFDRTVKIGEVVNVVSDTLSEMGAEDDKEFIKITDLNLAQNSFQNKSQNEYPILNQIKKVKGITVNTVHGNDESIAKVRSLYSADVESMEGAAFFRACEDMGKNYLQLRAVSNYVEKRDKSKWDISLAIKNVNEIVISLVNEINSRKVEYL